MFDTIRTTPTVVGLVLLVGLLFVFFSFLLPQSTDLSAIRIAVMELVGMALGYLFGVRSSS